jgi:hypothetical protein
MVDICSFVARASADVGLLADVQASLSEAGHMLNEFICGKEHLGM